MKSIKIKEKILLFKIRNHQDKEAFGEIYDLYVSAIYRFVFFKINSREQAEDLTSEIFLKIWDYLTLEEKDNFRIEDFRPFIYKVARNIVIDYYRKQSKKQEVAFTEDNVLPISDQQRNLFGKLYKQSQINDLYKLLSKLKSEYREVLALRYIEEFSIAEISSIISKSKGATRVLLHRALNTLRELYEQYEQTEQTNEQKY